METSNVLYYVTSTKRCVHCNESLSGCAFLSCGTNYWHTNHFFCCADGCTMDLANETFFEHEDKPYCEIHYYFIFAPKCVVCNYPITDNVLEAAGNSYHGHCLRCAECASILGPDDKFVARNNKVFCSKDYDSIFAPFCAL